LVQFGIHAMGLENMIAEEADPSEKDVEVTAGMSLDMIDVSLRPITFFTGQSGLMSAVWNAPSEPVSAFQVYFTPIYIYLFELFLQCIFLYTSGYNFDQQIIFQVYLWTTIHFYVSSHYH